MAVDKNSPKKKKEVSEDVKQQMQQLGNLLKDRDFKDEPEHGEDEIVSGQREKRGSKHGSIQRTSFTNVSRKSSSSDDDNDTPTTSPVTTTKPIEAKEVELENPKPDIQAAGLGTPEEEEEGEEEEEHLTSTTMTIVNSLDQKVASVPILDPKSGLKSLRKENAATEKAKTEEIKKAEKIRHKKLRIYEEKMGYIQPPMIVQLLKTSMRYVPGQNEAPNIFGRSDDPPHVFKDAERTVLPRIESNERLLSLSPKVPKASKTRANEKPKDPKPAFGLAWPSDQSNLRQKTHENMLAAFLNYYSKKAEAEEAGYSGTTMYDPNLSVSCAIACGKSPYPKFLTKGMKLEFETGTPYTHITAPDLHPMHNIRPKKSVKNFIPVGFILKEEMGDEVPDNYVEINLPLFPDTALKDIGIPSGAKAGFMDSSGTFTEARPGDPLPLDSTIGYLDETGAYHQVLDVESAMNEGQIEHRSGYGIRTSSAMPEETTGIHNLAEQEQSIHHGVQGQLLTSATGNTFMAGVSDRESARIRMPSQFGKPAINLFSSTQNLPGAVNLHQSQAVFVGVGERKTYETDENHKVREKKKKKKKKNKAHMLDSEGELGLEPIEDAEDDDVDYGDYGFDAYDEYDDEGEGERRHTQTHRVDRVEGEAEGGEEEDGEGAELTGSKSKWSNKIGRKPRPSRPSTVTTVITSDLYTAYDLKSAAPEGVSVGYLDEKGEFVEVREGEEIPVNVQTVFKDESNVIQKLKPPPKAQTIMEVSKIGFKNKDGVFVEIKPGDGAPQDAVLGFLDENGTFQERTSDFGYIDENGKFVHLDPATGVKPPVGANVGYMGQDHKFHPKPAKTGYRNANGEFVELKKNEIPPAGVTLGYLDSSETFNEEKQIPTDAQIGYVENGVFKPLLPNEEPPHGVAIGFRRPSSGAFIPMQDPDKGFYDSQGVFQQTKPEVMTSNKIPPGAPMGFVDKENTFHELQPGETVPKGTLIGFKNSTGAFVPVNGHGHSTTHVKKLKPISSKPSQYIENPHEVIEVEIRDENDLDEQGVPRIKVVLRHRASIQAPKNAKKIEGDGKVWIDGDEQVTELPYVDEHDVDENGQPIVKRMRVRTRLDDVVGEGGVGGAKPGKLGRQYGRGQLPRPGDPDFKENYEVDDEENLREAPLTQEELQKLIEFQRHVAVQCELDFIEGSLDLGEVIRKSFRIYSNGASIDIEPTIAHEEVKNPKDMQTKDNIDDNNYWEDQDDEEREEMKTNQVKHQSKDKSAPKKSYPAPH